MSDKEYICAYKYCIHPDSKVKASESVVISKKHYHWDCADIKNQIKDCVESYMELKEDKTEFPAATKIINNLVFKNRIPVDYIFKKINSSKMFYRNKPVHVLYGLRKLFWQNEMNV